MSERLNEIINNLNYNGQIFYRLDYAIMAQEKGYSETISNLLSRMIQSAIQIAKSVHDENCPLHTDHLSTLANGICYCLPEGIDGIAWIISFSLSKLAYQVLYEQDYSTYPIFIDMLKQKLAHETREDVIKILTNALSLIEPFYTEIQHSEPLLIKS